MLFNSVPFLFFFIVVTASYFLLPHKGRWLLLLVASCYFYMAFVPVYILILGFTILVDYAAGIFIERSAGRRRKYFLVLSIIANVGVLCIFKYYHFINYNISGMAHLIGKESPLPLLNILLPIGLSFHTFQALSYTIEVYRGRQKAERHLGIYALYVMFYPQLVAGPIERPQNLLPQLRKEQFFDYGRITSGLRLMGWGLFKKVVIADRLSVVVDTVFYKPGEMNSPSLAIGAVFFSFQIYCDFSGYSDMAIGAARVMGIKLMDNFRRPYAATNIRAFWARWHISLSTWFRDYVYIPLGGNRTHKAKWVLNISIVFLLSGLWHGANYTFIIWGLLHGLFYLAYSLLSKGGVTARIPGFIGAGFTFVLVTLAWVFFRAEDLPQAALYLQKLFAGIPALLSAVAAGHPVLEKLGLSPFEFDLSVLLILALMVVQWIDAKYDFAAWLKSRNPVTRWALYLAFVLSILLLGVDGTKQFIYFQF